MPLSSANKYFAVFDLTKCNDRISLELCKYKKSKGLHFPPHFVRNSDMEPLHAILFCSFIILPHVVYLVMYVS